MAIERTFSIIKPDATERNLTGAVNALIEKAGLRIVAQKRIRMTRDQAGGWIKVVDGHRTIHFRHSGAERSDEPGIHNHHREYGFRACAKRRILRRANWRVGE